MPAIARITDGAIPGCRGFAIERDARGPRDDPWKRLSCFSRNVTLGDRREERQLWWSDYSD